MLEKPFVPCEKDRKVYLRPVCQLLLQSWPQARGKLPTAHKDRFYPLAGGREKSADLHTVEHQVGERRRESSPRRDLEPVFPRRRRKAEGKGNLGLCGPGKGQKEGGHIS